MLGKLVFDLAPTSDNARNSEGAFASLPESGEIIFCYSRFSGSDGGDDATCDIAMVKSRDKGESWGEPAIIARASDFGVDNLMSVSIVVLDGEIVVLFIVKEMSGDTTFGTARTKDGVNFVCSRCKCGYIGGYYVLNNDRAELLESGRIILPVAFHRLASRADNGRISDFDGFGIGYFFYSDDGLRTIAQLPARMSLGDSAHSGTGIQEPGLTELGSGTLWVYARTDMGYQYESFSRDGLASVTPAAPSRFTSPASPMKIKRNPYTGELFAVWNPIPSYNGRTLSRAGWGRTPLAISRSSDDGVNWSAPTLIEDDAERGYCYPSLFFADADTLLCSYCRGGEKDGMCLARLGIMKINLADIAR